MTARIGNVTAIAAADDAAVEGSADRFGSAKICLRTASKK